MQGRESIKPHSSILRTGQRYHEATSQRQAQTPKDPVVPLGRPTIDTYTISLACAAAPLALAPQRCSLQRFGGLHHIPSSDTPPGLGSILDGPYGLASFTRLVSTATETGPSQAQTPLSAPLGASALGAHRPRGNTRYIVLVVAVAVGERGGAVRVGARGSRLRDL